MPSRLSVSGRWTMFNPLSVACDKSTILPFVIFPENFVIWIPKLSFEEISPSVLRMGNGYAHPQCYMHISRRVVHFRLSFRPILRLFQTKHFATDNIILPHFMDDFAIEEVSTVTKSIKSHPQDENACAIIGLQSYNWLPNKIMEYSARKLPSYKVIHTGKNLAATRPVTEQDNCVIGVRYGNCRGEFENFPQNVLWTLK